MGLEKLKSIFSDIQPINQTDLSSSPTQFDDDYKKTDLTSFKSLYTENVGIPPRNNEKPLPYSDYNKLLNKTERDDINITNTFQDKMPFVTFTTMDDSYILNNIDTQVKMAQDSVIGNIGGPVDFRKFGQYGNEIPDGFRLNMSKTEMDGVQTTLHNIGEFSLLTSPPYYFGDKNAIGLNFEFPKSDEIVNRPTVHNYFKGGKISPTNFESNETLQLKNYNDVTFDGRVGKDSWKKEIGTFNSYRGSIGDDGLGGIFNQGLNMGKYKNSFSPNEEPTPTLNQIILQGNIDTREGYPRKLPGKVIFDSGITPQKYQEGGALGSTWFKEGSGKFPHSGPILGDSYPIFNPLIQGLSGNNGGLQTRTIQVDLDTIVGNDLKSSQGWESLYNANHTAKDGVGYNYPNVNRSNLNIRYDIADSSPIYDANINRGKEPYVISKIGRNRFSGREFPAKRSLNDLKRLKDFYKSPRGINHILMENVKTLVANSGVNESTSLPGGIRRSATVQRFLGKYSGPLSGLIGALRPFGYATPIKLVDRTFPIETFDKRRASYQDALADYLNKKPLSNQEQKYESRYHADYKKINFNNNVQNSIQDRGKEGKFSIGQSRDWDKSSKPDWKGKSEVRGDKMTMAPLVVSTHWPNTEDAPLAERTAQYTVQKLTSDIDIESEANGMPVYFKNLVTGEYLFFRGYLEALTENIVPTWAEENYVGRSEPIHIYERTSRDLSFTLKCFAQSQNEMEMLMIKLNKLQAMCYPSYRTDTNQAYLIGNTSLGKTRMTPPLTKLRIGEWIGNKKNDGQTGFIMSISHTIPETSPWETLARKRVPKHWLVNIAYKVIANEGVPTMENGSRAAGLGNRFYGYHYDYNKAPFTALHKDAK